MGLPSPMPILGNPARVNGGVLVVVDNFFGTESPFNLGLGDCDLLLATESKIDGLIGDAPTFSGGTELLLASGLVSFATSIDRGESSFESVESKLGG